MSTCQFVIVASITCTEPHDCVIAGKRLCADHAVSMYPEIEHQGVEMVQVSLRQL